MTINADDFFVGLLNHGIEFFTGVPDTILKDFCLCIDDHKPKTHHVIAANEGNAIALATGYHFATNKIPLVYMQNSGMGNAMNPLLSLCDPDVYSIPMLLMIGWRGVPNKKDEPQHVKQGKIQLKLLETMEIPYEIISKDDAQYEKKIQSVLETMKRGNRPVAILIKAGTFEKKYRDFKVVNHKLSRREEVLSFILENLDEKSIIVSTTGKTSREIFEIREKNRQSHIQDFLTVGSMGHCSSIALGIAITKPDRNVVCVDGDGALIMHMGFLSTVGKLKPKNFFHILINNQAHESVGGQPTSAKFVDINALVLANGYKNAFCSDNPMNLKSKFDELINSSGPNFLEVLVKIGSRADLCRPYFNIIDNKKTFMDFVQGG